MTSQSEAISRHFLRWWRHLSTTPATTRRWLRGTKEFEVIGDEFVKTWSCSFAKKKQQKTKTKNDWCVSPFFRIKSQAQLRQIISEEVHRIYFNLIWNSEIEFELAPEMAQNRYASSRKKQNETKQKKKEETRLDRRIESIINNNHSFVIQSVDEITNIQNKAVEISWKLASSINWIFRNFLCCSFSAASGSFVQRRPSGHDLCTKVNPINDTKRINTDRNVKTLHSSLPGRSYSNSWLAIKPKSIIFPN